MASTLPRGEHNDMIRNEPCRRVHGSRQLSFELNPLLGAGDEERGLQGESVEAFKVDLPAVHDVDGAGRVRGASAAA